MVNRRKLLAATGACAVGAIAGRPLAQPAPALRLVVVVGAGSAVRELELPFLRALFAGDAVDGPGGVRLVPWNDVTGSPVRQAFDAVVLRMSPDQVGRYWVDRRIRGQTGAPRSIPSASVRQRLLAKFSQCVTYVASHELDPSVRPLRIAGRDWNEAAYPLVR